MIETPVLDTMDAEDLLSLTASTHRQQVESDALILRLAAEWTDRYNADALQKRPTPTDDSGEVLPGMERPKQFGGEGTPKVLEFAPAEFGITLEMSTGQTAALIADVLDLRHRLPKLWARVCALQVAGWKARAVAKATRHLSLEDCLAVDEAIHQSITQLAWSRFRTVLDGEIIKANPEEAQQRADAAERDRFVRLGRSNEYGLKTIYARAAAGDVLWLDATIDRLARIMAASGDADPLDVRRSKALGILANPLLAAGMLAEAEGLDLSDPGEDEDPDGDGFPHEGRWVPPIRKEWIKEGEEEPPADPDVEPTLPDDPENLADSADPDVEPNLPDDPENLAAPAEDSGTPESAASDHGNGDDHEADDGNLDAGDPLPEPVEGLDPASGIRDKSREHSGPAANSDPTADDHEPSRTEEQQESSACNTESRYADGPHDGQGTEDQDPSRRNPKFSPPDDENDRTSDPNLKGEVCPHCRSNGSNPTGNANPSAGSDSDDAAWLGPKPTKDRYTDGKGKAYRTIRARAAKAGLTALAQAGFNPDKVLPKVVLYAHYAAETLTDANGVIRIEGIGPVTLEHLRRHLGSSARIIVKPVIDLNDQPAPVDAYEIPARIREQIKLRQIGDLFPFATAGDTHQLDHTNAYLDMLRGGCSGQTAIENLALLKIFSHRLKTHGRFQCLQPRSGTLIWRSPHGYISITDHTGTHNLGNDPYAHAIWDASVRVNAETQGCPTVVPTAEQSSVARSRVDYNWFAFDLAS